MLESIARKNTSVQYTYDKAGRKVGVQTPAALSRWSYDHIGRPTRIQHQGIADYALQWDAANRIISMDSDGDRKKFDYDKTSQLLSATSSKMPSQKFEYDLNGNRRNFNIGKNNRLLNDGESAYGYDDEGNRISKGATRYFWDHRNRLVKVESPKDVIEYTYDYMNRLVKRTTANDATFFVYDGWQIAMTLNADGSVKERFLWGAGQDELVAVESNGVVAYALGDHQNTVRDLIDSKGDKLDYRDYDAFGNRVTGKAEKGYSFGYTGKFFDHATGLQWNINRWYDPKIGKWISEDPICFDGNDANLSRYAHQNPVSNIDSRGLDVTYQYVTAYSLKKAGKLDGDPTTIDGSLINTLSGILGIWSGNTTGDNFLSRLQYTLSFPTFSQSSQSETFSLSTQKYKKGELYKVVAKYYSFDGITWGMVEGSEDITTVKCEKYSCHDFAGNGNIRPKTSVHATVGGVPIKVYLKGDFSMTNVSIKACKYNGIIFQPSVSGAGTVEVEAGVGSELSLNNVIQLKFGVNTYDKLSASFSLYLVPVSPTNLENPKLGFSFTNVLNEYGVQANANVAGWGLNLHHKVLKPLSGVNIKIAWPF